MTLDAHAPPGSLDKKWTTYKNSAKIISPANKRKYKLIIVGSGLAGASAAATLGEQGFNIECFCYQDSARRAIPSPPRAGSTPRRTIKTTETAFTGFSMTPSKAGTFAPAKRMFIGSPRLAR